MKENTTIEEEKIEQEYEFVSTKRIKKSKNKKLMKFFYRSLVKNRLFISLFIIFTLIPIMVNLTLQIIINNSALPVVSANSNMVYIGMASFLSFMLISVLTTFILFVNSKNNGSLLYLYTLDYKRNFLYKARVLTVIFVTFLSTLIVFVANIIIGNSFGNMSNSFFFAMFVTSFLFLLFMSVVFAFYSYFLKSVAFIVASTITILCSMGLFFLGALSTNNSSNKLEFNENINQNNYSRLFLTDKDGNEKDDYIIVNKRFDNTINTSDNLEKAFQGVDNNMAMNFSSLNIFTQLTSSIQDSMGGRRNYTQEELYEISKSDYSHNYNVFSLKNHGTGDPDEIKDSDANKIFISYQDANPFKMSYDEVFGRISNLITEKKLISNGAIIDSIVSKTSNDDYWSNENVSLSNQELSILKDYSGVEENEWLFYIHNYYPFIKNKLVKLKDDLVVKFGDKIAEFIWFIFDGEKYNNNLLKFNIIQPKEKIEARFPLIGDLDENTNADLADVVYFKKELIHHVGDDQLTTFKIKEKNSNGYSLIDLTKIDPSIKTINDWENYIDNNLEVVNLRNLYDKLFVLDNDIEPEYRFNNNVDDIYRINRVMEIEQIAWIDNIWIHILIILSLTIIISLFTNKVLYKKEGKDVE